MGVSADTRDVPRLAARPVRRLLPAALTLLIVLASCSAITGDEASTSETTIPDALALVEDTTAGTPFVTNPRHGLDQFENFPTSSTELTTATTTPGSASPTSVRDAGKGTKGTQAPGDLMDQYTGIVGNYTLHQVLATAPAPAPASIAGAAPLTGWPGSASGPAVVVKIDNSGKATPQSGLNRADIVIEEEVEWGITRLAAIFHSQHGVVGPVRSGRTTDISYLGALGRPALVYSGANQITDTLLLRQTHVQNFSAARNGAYWRDSSRRAPSNLYANTDSFNNSGSSPAPWFAYRAEGVPASGSPVSQVSMTLGSTSVRWAWTDGAWFRQQGGSAHKTDGGAQVSASNIVVATVQEVHTGMVDSSGGPVPEFIWAGSGPVSVFTDGKRIDGTWTRATLADVAILTDSSGNVIQLTPGRTWVELVTGGVSSS